MVKSIFIFTSPPAFPTTRKLTAQDEADELREELATIQATEASLDADLDAHKTQYAAAGKQLSAAEKQAAQVAAQLET